MIHVDARTPDQFYDERYDSYICFLTRGSGRSESTQPEVFQPRIGGEGALIGAEGVKSFQNPHGDESLPDDNPITCQKNSVLCVRARNYLVHTSSHLVPLPDLRVATAMAMYDLRREIFFA